MALKEGEAVYMTQEKKNAGYEGEADQHKIAERNSPMLI